MSDRGSNFLLHIERQLGGLDVFRPYIKAYIQEFSGKVVTTDEWRSHLYAFFGSQGNGKEYVKKLDEIKWDEVGPALREARFSSLRFPLSSDSGFMVPERICLWT